MLCGLRPLTTVAPCAANSSAIAAPMPEDKPVTRTTGRPFLQACCVWRWELGSFVEWFWDGLGFYLFELVLLDVALVLLCMLFRHSTQGLRIEKRPEP